MKSPRRHGVDDRAGVGRSRAGEGGAPRRRVFGDRAYRALRLLGRRQRDGRADFRTLTSSPQL
jgi:hypothetical protein